MRVGVAGVADVADDEADVVERPRGTCTNKNQPSTTAQESETAKLHGNAVSYYCSPTVLVHMTGLYSSKTLRRVWSMITGG